jgi:hypothetical protein
MSVMYGIVNKAVEDFVSSNFGAEVWARVKQTANCDVDTFISLETYPDQMTYSLVAAGEAVCGIPAAKILESFGEHWVRFTDSEAYGELLRSTGRSLPSFLNNLDQMHRKVEMSFEGSKMPSFKCQELQPGILRLEYYSDRPGLVPFVQGLVRGAGRLFHIEVEVSPEGPCTDRGRTGTAFRVTYDPPQVKSNETLEAAQLT